MRWPNFCLSGCLTAYYSNSNASRHPRTQVRSIAAAETTAAAYRIASAVNLLCTSVTARRLVTTQRRRTLRIQNDIHKTETKPLDPEPSITD
jgi:hypothetical protein